MKILLILVLVILVACGNRPLRPVDIEASDICAHCKMAISEKRYAAELFDPEGEAIKFDSVECMVRYVNARNLKPRVAAWFLMDSDGHAWLNAQQAFLVKPGTVSGPMGSGVLVTKDLPQANQMAQRYSGQVVRFDDLWK